MGKKKLEKEAVPVNIEKTHWFVIIYIAPKEPEEGKLLVFDSMNSTRDDEIEIVKKGICHMLQQDIQMLQPEYVNCKKQIDSRRLKLKLTL